MDMVRIQFTTFDGTNAGKITGEPMPRTEAIEVLYKTYSLNKDRWEYNVQARTIGATTWTWALLSV